MRLRCRCLCKVLLALYLMGSLITSFLFIRQTLRSSEKRVLPPWKDLFIDTFPTPVLIQKTNVKVVDIWGKAAIGLYLWQHLFEGQMHLKSPGWNTGEMLINGTLFRFHTGPGVALQTVPLDTSNVLLVLNGRDSAKIEFARDWLNYATGSAQLRSLGVVLLGNEQCTNTWIREYLWSSGGPVKYLFLVYDSPEVDDKVIFQWPLGVATYRNFPVVSDEVVDLDSPRKYTCNFIGTIHPNSTREILVEVLRKHQLTDRCYVLERSEWQPGETRQSLYNYVRALHSSDLTLNPAGMNAECYRIYEAMSFGSVPVIEDRSPSSTCGDPTPTGESAVFRLLKKFQAPVIFLDDWNALPRLIQRERLLSLGEVVTRRKAVVEWYRRFRHQMRDRLVGIVGQNI